MIPNAVTEVCITLGNDPDSIKLIDDGAMRIRITEGVCLYVNDATTPEVLRALVAAADTAAELLDAAQIVALNTPAVPQVDATVHTMRLPDYGTGRAS